MPCEGRASGCVDCVLGRGLAQERLALDAGVDRTVVSKIERAVTNPSLEILLRLANQLEVELADLFKAR